MSINKEKYKQETGPPQEILEARGFFINELSFLDPQKLNTLPLNDLFSLYRDYINQQASRENFKYLIDIYGKIAAMAHENFYKDYLLEKLPKELSSRILKENRSVPDIEEIHRLRKENHTRMLLGFHVSDFSISPPETIKESLTESQIGDVILPRGAYVQYVDNPTYLYGPGGQERYLYFVEGSESDKITHPNGWRARAIKEDGRGLEILGKLKLTPELEEELGLKFRGADRHR